MKTWALITGALMLGVLFGYALFLLTSSSTSTDTFPLEESYGNGAFQNAILPTTPSTSKGSTPFKTQSFTDKHTVIE